MNTCIKPRVPDVAPTISATEHAVTRHAHPPLTRNHHQMKRKVDFDEPMSATQLATERTRSRSKWTELLHELQEGVQAGRGEYDVFYRIATFKNCAGARGVIRDLQRNPARIPGAFDLQSRICTDSETGRKYSELWAAVPSD